MAAVKKKAVKKTPVKAKAKAKAPTKVKAKPKLPKAVTKAPSSKREGNFARVWPQGKAKTEKQIDVWCRKHFAPAKVPNPKKSAVVRQAIEDGFDEDSTLAALLSIDTTCTWGNKEVSAARRREFRTQSEG